MKRRMLLYNSSFCKQELSFRGIACTHPLASILRPARANTMQETTDKSYNKRCRRQLCEYRYKPLKWTQHIHHASLGLGEGGRSSALVNDWLASRTNRVQRVIFANNRDPPPRGLWSVVYKWKSGT